MGGQEMRFCPLFSGSSGNSIYVGSDDTHLLVDIGASNKQTEAVLNHIDLTGRDINGILITHEHVDHIGGLGVFSRKYKVPLYLTQGTAEAMQSGRYRTCVGDIDSSLINIIRPDEEFMIGDICVNPMRISHDAADPVGYRFRCGDKTAAVCTDLGTYTDYTVKCLEGMDVMLIEANHDVRMLETGPYPYPLKRRILSDTGHLCNESSGKLISSILHDRVKKIFLGHLSLENNDKDLAYEAVRAEITMSDNPYRPNDFDIGIARRGLYRKEKDEFGNLKPVNEEPVVCIEF